MHLFRILISLLLIGYGSYSISRYLFIDFEQRPATVVESYKKLIPANNTHRPDKHFYSFKYEYTFADKIYTSDKYTYAGGKSEAVCEFKQGQKITAYVNPNNPSFAVIKHRISGYIMAITVIGLLMLVASILSYIVDINKQKNRTNPTLQKANMLFNMFIGLGVFVTGMGYFVYKIVKTVKDCV
jgi:hypothetical protein